MKKKSQIKKEGRRPFFHYTHQASDMLHGPFIDEIIGDLYKTFDTTWHVAFIVPNKYKETIEDNSNL